MFGEKGWYTELICKHNVSSWLQQSSDFGNILAGLDTEFLIAHGYVIVRD